MASALKSFLTTDRNRSIDPTAIAPRGGIGGVLWVAVSVTIVGALMRSVKQHRTADFDREVTLAVQRSKPRWFDRLMRLVSWPGFPPQSRTLPPLMAVGLWLRGMRLEALFQMAAWGTGGISSIVKRNMQRPRPHAGITGLIVVPARIGGTSFPSGHVIIYTGVYGFLTYLASIWIRGKALKRAVVGALLGLLALVGPSRVYLGHHWFTDTVASYLLGTSYLVGLTALYRRVKRWTLRG